MASAASSSSRRREQVTVACKRCRSKKTKCDGVRPTCSSCSRRKTPCEWDTHREPDAHPIVAVKRKLEQIQPQLAQYQQLFSLLREGSDAEAYRVFTAVRSGSDIEEALQAARFQRSPGWSVNLQQLPASRRTRPARRPASLPPCRRDAAASSARETTSYSHLRRIASQDIVGDSKYADRQSSHPARPQKTSEISLRDDPRINAARSSDWGVTYLDDESFRNLLRCWFTWDHPCVMFFDQELFLDQLSLGQPSELCTPLLIHAIIALGSRNFCFIDRSKAEIAEHFGLATATKLWEIGQQEATPAVIVAGMALFLCKELNGQDKIGWPYLATAEHLGSRAGLFRAAMADTTYSRSEPRRTRGRQAVAYGLFNFRAYLSLTNDLPPLSSPPSIPPLEPTSEWTTWTAWPWSTRRSQREGQLFHARSTLSLIAADIMPLHRRYEAMNVTREHHAAALEIWNRLQHWYDILDPTMKRLEVSTPHAIAIHNYYHLAITQLFSPFVLEAKGIWSFLPSGEPLRRAGLPHHSAVSGYSGAMKQLQADLLHLDRQWSPNFPTPPTACAPLVHVCMAALPILSHDLNARYIFSVGLIMCSRVARVFTIYRSIIRSIRLTAQRKGATLSALAQRIFDRLESDYPVMPVLDKVQSTFIVDARLRHVDVDASTVEGVIRDMEEMNLT